MILPWLKCFKALWGQEAEGTYAILTLFALPFLSFVAEHWNNVWMVIF